MDYFRELFRCGIDFFGTYLVVNENLANLHILCILNGRPFFHIFGLHFNLSRTNQFRLFLFGIVGINLQKHISDFVCFFKLQGLSKQQFSCLALGYFSLVSLIVEFDLNVGSFLLEDIEMGLIRGGLPIMDEMERIWGSGGAVLALGAYFDFLRILAERKPYFWFLSVSTSQLLQVSCSPTMIFPPTTTFNSSGLQPKECFSNISKWYSTFKARGSEIGSFHSSRVGLLTLAGYLVVTMVLSALWMVY